MLTKTVIGKKSDAHDSKESPRFASRLKKKGPTLDPHSCKVEHKTTFNLSKLEFLHYLKITSIKMHIEHIITRGLLTGGLICFTGFFIDVIFFTIQRMYLVY